MGWAFWRQWRRRPTASCAYASTAAADEEPSRAEAHERDIQRTRELLERLSDELEIMTPNRDRNA